VDISATDMTVVDRALDRLGRWLARRLRQEARGEEPFIPADPQALRRTLRPADVLLVAGASTLSTAINLTQSTWSHAAMYVGDVLESGDRQEPHTLNRSQPR
jgi:hypothetical protein